MKIAFVVGFFDPVKKALDARFPNNDRLIWIEPGKKALIVFKQRFYDVVKTAHDLLVCLGRRGSEKHLEDAATGIIAVAREQFTAAIQFRAFGNLYDPAPVVALVDSFGIEIQPQIVVHDVRKKVSYGKIICVSLAGKTS